MSTITHSPELVCLARSLFEVGIDIFFEKNPSENFPFIDCDLTGRRCRNVDGSVKWRTSARDRQAAARLR